MGAADRVVPRPSSRARGHKRVSRPGPPRDTGFHDALFSFRPRWYLRNPEHHKMP